MPISFPWRGRPWPRPRCGVAALPPAERNGGDNLVPSGGRVLDVVSVLDNSIDPGNECSVVIAVIPRERRYPQSGWLSSAAVVVGVGESSAK